MKKDSWKVGNRRRRCEGVIESSLYQIMTGAILSVLGRCFWLLLLLLLQVFFPSSAVLAERTKSNDESNSIRLLGLASHPPTPLSHPEVVPPPGFYRGFSPMNAAAVLLFLRRGRRSRRRRRRGRRAAAAASRCVGDRHRLSRFAGVRPLFPHPGDLQFLFYLLTPTTLTPTWNSCNK